MDNLGIQATLSTRKKKGKQQNNKTKTQYRNTELAIIFLKKTFAMLLLVKCGKSVVGYIGVGMK